MLECDAEDCEKPTVCYTVILMPTEPKFYCYRHGARAEELGIDLVWSD